MTTSRATAHLAGVGEPGIVDTLLAAEVHARLASGAVLVLDCGGGSGRYAVPLAVAGATVTVVDVSADALSTLRRRALEAAVAARITSVQGDVEDLANALAEVTASDAQTRSRVQPTSAGQFDLVLAHGVLQAVDDAAATFAAMVAELAPGAALSVLVSNPVAAVLSRALAGDLAGAERELADLDRYDFGGAGVGERVDPEFVAALCAHHGLQIEQRHGIGVFGDLVPGQALDEPGGREALARLESACARRSPFADIAASVHILARHDGAHRTGSDRDGT